MNTKNILKSLAFAMLMPAMLFTTSCGNEDEAIITMIDADSGEEYQFALVDDFEYKDQSYCVLVTMDEEDPEMVITKVVTMENGEEGLMSLDESEADEIYAEYDRLCDEAELEDEEDYSDEEN